MALSIISKNKTNKSIKCWITINIQIKGNNRKWKSKKYILFCFPGEAVGVWEAAERGAQEAHGGEEGEEEGGEKTQAPERARRTRTAREGRGPAQRWVSSSSVSASRLQLTLMLLVANLADIKWCKKSEEWLKPWHMGTHLSTQLELLFSVH